MAGPASPDMYQPPPGHPLHPYVQWIFRARWDGAGTQEVMLPKGNVDILFNLGAPLQGSGVVRGGHLANEGDNWIGGVRTQAYRVRPAGEVDLLGVCLRAETCAPLLPLSPSEIVDTEVHGAEVSWDLDLVGEQVREAKTFAQQCTILLGWLGSRLRPLRGARAVQHACMLLRQSRGDDPVGATAKQLAVSVRHLRRMVTEHVGVSPGEYVRLARFVRATHLMAEPDRSLGRVALSAGYYDQAHFCRDFRRFAGMTPQAYRQAASPAVVGHIYSSDGRSVQEEVRSVQDPSP